MPNIIKVNSNNIEAWMYEWMNACRSTITLLVFRKNILALIFLSSIFTSFSCSFQIPERTSIKIKGSDTMLYLTKQLAEEYMKKNTAVSIYVEGGGTAAGIRSFVVGETDICTASRTFKGEEVKILADHFKSVGISFIIAKDALTIFINPTNKVRNFSLKQLKKIFTGKITNWKELGGDDSKIVVLNRNPNSGTYLYFKEHVLSSEEYSPDVVTKPTTASIVDEVIADKNAIGYGGIGYQRDSAGASVEGIQPTEANVRNNTYPISRYLYFYTQSTPSGIIKDFIDWVIGPEGERVIEKAGYISLWEY
ncbi:MAG: phosphate ABC transporter substrate-binding protein [Ignavibacteriaceae bacterium]